MRATPSNAVMAAMVLLFCACSSDDGPPVLIDDFARAIADAHCNNIGPCCEQAGFPYDAMTCHAAAEAEMRAEVEGNKANPNLTYDGNAARGCVNAYTAMVKACHEEREIGTACRFVFVGNVQSGQPCTTSTECAPGMSCQRGGDAGAMVCGTTTSTSTLVRGKVGDGCRSTCTQSSDGVSTSCSTSGGGQGPTPGPASCYTNDGLYCDATFICAVQPAIGQPCTGNTACAGDAFCDTNVCAAKRTTGSCGQLGNGCTATAYCDATRQCQLRKATGSACTTSNECLSTDRCTMGTCRTRSIASATACMGNL